MDMASLAIVHQVPTVEEGGIAKQISAEELGRVYVELKTKSIHCLREKSL